MCAPLDCPEKLVAETLLKLAIIAHEVYMKYDVAAEALRAYDSVMSEQISEAYAKAIY